MLSLRVADKDFPREDGEPFYMRYVFPARRHYTVINVKDIKYRAPLFSPPGFMEDANEREWYLSYDLYERF